jgi:hypothetical protein
MKVLNLQCSQEHVFEGWFASEGDFRDQLDRGLLECPLCEDTGVQKLPSAPRLNLGARLADARLTDTPSQDNAGALAVEAEFSPRAGTAVPGRATQQATFLNALRELIAHTEDVGSRFADRAA